MINFSVNSTPPPPTTKNKIKTCEFQQVNLSELIRNMSTTSNNKQCEVFWRVIFLINERCAEIIQNPKFIRCCVCALFDSIFKKNSWKKRIVIRNIMYCFKCNLLIWLSFLVVYTHTQIKKIFVIMFCEWNSVICTFF